MRKRELIAGNSYQAAERLEKRLSECAKLKYVTVFFENANFLITKYKPLSNAVYLILELEDGTELHMEGANCGYGGSGPHETLRILKIFGIEGSYIEQLIFQNDAVRFQVEGERVLVGTVDTAFLFFPRIRLVHADNSFRYKIQTDLSVDINLEKGKLMFYNPQRTNFMGFLNLLSYMEDMEFEYYIGTDSPLEGGIRLKEIDDFRFYGMDKPDIKGIEQVNLLLTGSNFSVACWIDKNDEWLVIESIYLALTGRKLFSGFDLAVPFWEFIIEKFRFRRNGGIEKYGKINIEKKRLNWRMR